MKTNEIIMLVVIASLFIISFSLYPRMPNSIATHWDSYGKVNGYMPKFWGLFLMPMVCFGLFILFIIIPKIDPLKKNIEKFKKEYERFILLTILFFFYIHILVILWNKGTSFNMSQALVPALSILFYYIGVLLEKAKRNWFIGIRNPWTLSSNKVWVATHRATARLFKFTAIIILLGMIFPDYLIYLILVPVAAIIVFTTIYSYAKYKIYNQTNKL